MEDCFRLDGQRLLVTGASSGIGAATAQRLAERGGTVLLTGRDTTRLAEVQSSLTGEGHRSVAADLCEPEERGRLVAELEPLDGVVFCAGVVKASPAKFWTQRDWAFHSELNQAVPLLLTRELLKAKRVADGGSIVCVSSISAHHPSVGYGLYAASKAGLEAAARTLALELAPRRIRVNCLAPGLVETPMTAASSEVPDASMQAYRERYPLGTGQPEDVAAAAAFLLSAGARWITGTTLILDGGISLT
ncbi:MAG: SDR family NAD(P)-dependent oxidoreductase [Opitutales bacterium]